MRFIRGLRFAHGKPDAFVKGGDLDPFDLIRGQIMRVAMGQNPFDWGLCPTADGVGFVILFQRIPAFAKIRPGFRHLFHNQGWSAGETGLCQRHRRGPRHRPPSSAVFQHRGMVDQPHHLAARTVVFCNSQRVAGLFG